MEYSLIVKPNVRPNLVLALMSVNTEYSLVRPSRLKFEGSGRGRAQILGHGVRVAAIRSLKLALGKFAWFCIDARLGGDPAAGVQLALRHYRRRLKSNSAPVGFPEFYRHLESERSTITFDLPIDSELEAMIGGEARKYGTSVSQIAAHAVFVYLADLEAGRSAA